MASRSGAQPRAKQYIYVSWQVGLVDSLEQDNIYALWQVGVVHSLEQDNIYALWQVGLVDSLEKDNITVLCQASLEAFDGEQRGVEESRWRGGET